MIKLKIKLNEIIKVNALKKKIGNIQLIDNDYNKLSISQRLGLLSLNIFTVSIKYKIVNSSDIIANYKMYAEGEQKCVISLRPVKFIVKKSFDIKFFDQKKIELSLLEDEF